ncbi:MAG: peroxidase-related enzyme [Verrucomicrobia bacterium]|nr:peroxidase-related enzyme [Verrucomicrobiota bacterium]
MAYLKQIPTGGVLLDLFKVYPDIFVPIIEYHQKLLRESSSLSVAERELIAAFVSGVNACRYCTGVHAATARAFGVDERLLSQLLENLESARVDARLKPIFRYVRKLTETPSRMTQEDADQVFGAGWDDRALFDAVAICALFNCMNRLVEGLGIAASADYFSVSAKRLSAAEGYLGLVQILKNQTPPNSVAGNEGKR